MCVFLLLLTLTACKLLHFFPLCYGMQGESKAGSSRSPSSRGGRQRAAEAAPLPAEPPGLSPARREAAGDGEPKLGRGTQRGRLVTAAGSTRLGLRARHRAQRGEGSPGGLRGSGGGGLRGSVPLGCPPSTARGRGAGPPPSLLSLSPRRQVPFLLFILTARTEPPLPPAEPSFCRPAACSPFKLGEEEEEGRSSSSSSRRGARWVPGARAGSLVLSAGAAGLCLPPGARWRRLWPGWASLPPVPLFLSGGDWPRLGKVRKGTGGKGTRQCTLPHLPAVSKSNPELREHSRRCLLLLLLLPAASLLPCRLLRLRQAGGEGRGGVLQASLSSRQPFDH